MRLAVVGSGGAGKSAISATLARLLARCGRRVVAVDLDPNPGLAWSLGVEPRDDGLPEDAVARAEGGLYGWGLAPGLSPALALERFSLPAPDGVRYLCPGKIVVGSDRVQRSLGAVRSMLSAAGPGWDVVGDLEAGTTCPYEGYAAFADRALVVVTPSWRSGLTGRRLATLLGELPVTVVASRFHAQPDHPGLAADIRIPADPCVRAAERCGRAVLDACPDSAFVGAVERLARMLTGGSLTGGSSAAPPQPV